MVTKCNNMKIITTYEMQKTNGKRSRKKIILEHWFEIEWLLTSSGILDTGKIFHNRGAITEKALSPTHFFETGTTKLVLPEERVLIAPSTRFLTVRQSWMYWGVSLSTHLYTYNKVLYIILSPTGNQCSWLSKGDTCSNLGLRQTSLAHLFRSFCRRFRSFFEIPFKRHCNSPVVKGQELWPDYDRCQHQCKDEFYWCSL